MHFGSAQRLFVDHLTGSHLHQRRSAQEHLRLILDHYHVVGHARQIRAAGRRVAEHNRDARDAHLRAASDLAKTSPARNEYLCLDWKIGARGFYEADAWQVVLRADVGEPAVLELADLAHRAAFDGCLVSDDQAFAARDQTDAAYHACSDELVLNSNACERRDLEKV